MKISKKLFYLQDEMYILFPAKHGTFAYLFRHIVLSSMHLFMFCMFLLSFQIFYPVTTTVDFSKSLWNRQSIKQTVLKGYLIRYLTSKYPLFSVGKRIHVADNEAIASQFRGPRVPSPV